MTQINIVLAFDNIMLFGNRLRIIWTERNFLNMLLRKRADPDKYCYRKNKYFFHCGGI